MVKPASARSARRPARDVAADLVAEDRVVAAQRLHGRHVDHDMPAGAGHAEHLGHRRPLVGRLQRVQHVERRHEVEDAVLETALRRRCRARRVRPASRPRSEADGGQVEPEGAAEPAKQLQIGARAAPAVEDAEPSIHASWRCRRSGVTKTRKPRNQKWRASACAVARNRCSTAVNCIVYATGSGSRSIDTAADRLVSCAPIFRRSVMMRARPFSSVVALVVLLGAAGRRLREETCRPRLPPPPPPPPAVAPTPPPPPPPPPPAPAAGRLRRRSPRSRSSRRRPSTRSTRSGRWPTCTSTRPVAKCATTRVPLLQRNADWLKRWASTQVSVEGHCRLTRQLRVQPGARLPPGRGRQGVPGRAWACRPAASR